MCEPVTISIATGLAVAGAAASAYSAYKQGQYAAAMGERQQQMSEIAAARTTQAGESRAASIRAQATDVIGSQRAAAGASGVDVGSGAPLAQIEQTGLKSSVDVETAKNNAAMQAWGIKVGGVEAKAAGEAGAAAGTWGAVGAGLGGAGSALGGYGQWQRWRRTGSAW